VQQEANRKLKWTARRTMQVAQKLYENGWITYMRTDSVSLSDQAIHAARELILNNYGSEYLPAVARTYKNTAKNAQEAHEAIRPAGERFKTIEEARSELDADEARLYELIWKRTVACQMEDATGKHLSVGVELVVPRLVNKPEVKTQWLATGKTIEFPGYRRAYVEGSDDPDAELADQ
jgi:DNA topoisomerase-1